MAWQIVKQPNGLFARWTDICDAFTQVNMTEQQVIDLGMEGRFTMDSKPMSEQEIRGKLERAIADHQWHVASPHQVAKTIPGDGDGLTRWRNCIKTHRFYYGDEGVQELLSIVNKGVFAEL
jgi:hypothetical protein